MTQALAKWEQFRDTLQRKEAKQQMASVLPPHISVERFNRISVTAVQKDPGLLDADRGSLFRAFLACATDGLVPDGREAAIVVFKGQAQYMPMYAGILKKVRQSGELVSICAQVVYQGDTWDYWIDDDGEHFKHIPNLEGSRLPEDVRHIYAMAKTRSGGVFLEVLTKAEVEKIRSISRAKDKGPWVTWWEEMAKKTAIRRLSKRLPMSTDLERVITADDGMYDLEQDEPQEAPVSAEDEMVSSRLRDIVGASPEPVADVEQAPEPEPVAEPEGEDPF